MDKIKTKNMLLYFIENSGDLPITKAMKLFFFSDLVAFSRNGTSISGMDYHSWDQGPVPPVLHRGLKKEKLEYVSLEQVGSSLFVRSNEGVKSDLSVFAEPEREVLKAVLDWGMDANSSQLSELTHRQIPWMKTELYEKISFEWTELQKAIQEEGHEFEDEEIILDVIKRNPQLHHFYECGLAEWLDSSSDSDYEELVDDDSLTPVQWEHGIGWVQGH